MSAVGAQARARWIPAWNIGLALLLILSLGLALAAVQSGHHYLIPPYENDFPGFADRASSLKSAVKLDGFYPLGYPLALWALSQGTGSEFVAAKAVAIGSSLLLIAASWSLARTVAPGGVSWLLPLLVVANPYFWESSLFLGTDMPWAAFQLLALGAAIKGVRRARWTTFAWAGAALGLAYLFRYTALVMAPVLWTYLLIWRPLPREGHQNGRAALAFTLAFLIVALPQLVTSAWERGNPFFTLQAKNVWFAIYGQGDWQGNWADLRSDIGLFQVISMGLGRFLAHWGIEFAKWWAYAGVLVSGMSRIALASLPTLGKAMLALAGLAPIGIIASLGLRLRGQLGQLRISSVTQFMVLYFVAYGLSIALVFVQPRFYLALLPVLLLAAISGARWALQSLSSRSRSLFCVWVIAASMLNSGLATKYVLRALQPPVGQVTQALQGAGATGNDVILASLAMPYAYRSDYHFEALYDGTRSVSELETRLRQQPAARFLLFEGDYGLRYWPGLAVLLRPEEAPSFLALLWQDSTSSTVLYQVNLGN